MGLEAAAIMAGVAVVAKAGQAETQVKDYHAKENALDMQAKQQTLQTQQKTLSNYDMMDKTIQAQNAQMTVRGTAFSSASFNAIQRETENIGAKAIKNTEIEGDLAQENIKMEKKNVRRNLYAQLFGDASDIGMSAAGAFAHMPTKGG
jgi:hypothetical protein